MEKLSITLPEKIACDEEEAVIKARYVRAKDQIKLGTTLSHDDLFDHLEGKSALEED